MTCKYFLLIRIYELVFRIYELRIYETTCREMPPEQVFVRSLAEINPRKVVEVVRRIHVTEKNTTGVRPIFSRDFAVNVQGLVFSGLNPTCQVSSKSIQVSQIY